MADLSVRNANESAQRMADVLLRATGGYTATLLAPPAQGDASDAGQLGLNAPGFQRIPLSPVSFRRTRAVVREGERAKYELLVSASCVLEQANALGFASADALFSVAAGISVASLNLVIEEWSASALLGEPTLYRLLLRVCEPQSATQQSA